MYFGKHTKRPFNDHINNINGLIETSRLSGLLYRIQPKKKQHKFVGQPSKPLDDDK